MPGCRHSVGIASLDRFNGGRDGTLWYYETLVKTYGSIEACTSRWLPELERVVADLVRLTYQAP